MTTILKDSSMYKNLFNKKNLSKLFNKIPSYKGIYEINPYTFQTSHCKIK